MANAAELVNYISKIKTFSSEKLLENEVNKNIVAVKKIKIYSLNLVIIYLIIK